MKVLKKRTFRSSVKSVETMDPPDSGELDPSPREKKPCMRLRALGFCEHAPRNLGQSMLHTRVHARVHVRVRTTKSSTYT